MFFTFVQHMETDRNAEGRFTAQVFHIRLNSTGIAEAERMADCLQDSRFTAIFCSDQIRAIETAVIIACRHEEAGYIVTDQRLREVNVGKLVGVRQAEVAEPLYKTRHPNFDFRPAGGESKSDVIGRLCAFIGQVKADYYNTGEVLIVGHGTALRVLLEHFRVPEVLTRKNFVRVQI